MRPSSPRPAMSSDNPAAQAAFPMRVSCRCRSSSSSGSRAAPSSWRSIARAARSSQSLMATRSIVPAMARTLREVVYVDGVRTAFGRAGKDGYFWKTRADDMAVKVVREAPAPESEPAGGSDRRRRLRSDGPGRRPGPDARPRRRAARRTSHVRAGLRRRPHVRGRADRDDERRGRDRDGRCRRRPGRRRRAHGPPPDGRRRRLQSTVRLGADRRRVRSGHGPDGREPPRRLSAPDEGGRGRVRGREPAPRSRRRGTTA